MRSSCPTKIWLYDAIQQSDLPHDPLLQADLVNYFPSALHAKYRNEILNRQSRRRLGWLRYGAEKPPSDPIGKSLRPPPSSRNYTHQKNLTLRMMNGGSDPLGVWSKKNPASLEQMKQMLTELKSADPQTPAGRRGLIAWAMFDWANSAFTTVIITFVFATYFAKGVVGDETLGTSYWGMAMGLSGLSIALLAPVFGAIADMGGRRKPWIAICTALCVIPTALLTFILPDAAYILPALILVAIANIGFEMGVVFNNAMLPDIISKDRIGRLSGWAWGLGYAGGLACLVIILAGFDLDDGFQLRATSLLVAIWFAVFSIPLFLWTPDQPASGRSAGEAVRDGLALLGRTLRDVRQHATIVRFLIAHMIYGDGLVTLFAMGGVFAQSAYGMTTNEVLQFAVLINVTAGLGAALFGWIDDRIGPKLTIQIALVSLAAIGGIILTVYDKTTFLILGAALGIFFGPAQAASRSLMARIVPQGKETEMFGLFALSGKATAFLGPIVFGVATAAFDSARAGMVTILAFFLIGALLLFCVPAPKR